MELKKIRVSDSFWLLSLIDDGVTIKELMKKINKTGDNISAVQLQNIVKNIEFLILNNIAKIEGDKICLNYKK